MEISVVNGCFGEYRYEGLWWRLGGEIHWKAQVLRDGATAAMPAGTLGPETRDREDESVRRCIEAFIATSEDAARRRRAPD